MSTKSSQTRFLLSEEDLPKFWYNVNADNPVPPAPVLHPGTKEPVTPDFLSVEEGDRKGADTAAVAPPPARDLA